jgi:hypothetical protein
MSSPVLRDSAPAPAHSRRNDGTEAKRCGNRRVDADAERRLFVSLCMNTTARGARACNPQSGCASLKGDGEP